MTRSQDLYNFVIRKSLMKQQADESNSSDGRNTVILSEARAELAR